MPEDTIPEEILIITPVEDKDVSNLRPRRGALMPRLINTQSVDIIHLKEQVNVFLQQINIVMSETPEKVGGFQLAEFEVSAGIAIEGKCQIRIALLGSGEVGGQMNAGLKFVFKRC